MAHSNPRQAATPPEDNRFDRILYAILIVGACVIAFLAGALASTARVFPGPQIAQAYAGGRALYYKVSANSDVYHGSDLWREQRDPRRGVTRLVAERVQPGATLYTSGEPSVAYLVAPDGEVLHRWHRNFSQIWTKDSPIANPQPDDHVYFRAAKMFPNGDLLVVIEGNGDTPYGYAIAKLDRNSNLLWVNYLRAHHDVTVGADGRIYVLAHSIARKRPPGTHQIADAWLKDYLVVLSPNGRELARLSLADLLLSSPYTRLIDTVTASATSDPLHANAVQLISPAAAAKLPFARAGNLLVSFRELNAIGVVDVERRKLVWATRGPWLGQHYPVALDNGNLLLFDNLGNYRNENGASRVIEFQPETMAIAWSYAGTPEAPFGSDIRGDQQRLANGNTLITESDTGRILEVTADGSLVWEFRNPARGGKNGSRIAIVNHAQRITAADLDPEFLALPPHPGPIRTEVSTR